MFYVSNMFTYIYDKNQLAGELANYHGNGESLFSVGNTSSEGPFSIAMLVCQRVNVVDVGECASPMDPSWVIQDSLTEITHSHVNGLS